MIQILIAHHLDLISQTNSPITTLIYCVTPPTKQVLFVNYFIVIVYVLFITIRNHILCIKDLYYKMLQDKTLVLKTDNHKNKDFKQSKDHVTLLLCTNQMGNHKLIFITKADKQTNIFYGCLFMLL